MDSKRRNNGGVGTTGTWGQGDSLREEPRKVEFPRAAVFRGVLGDYLALVRHTTESPDEFIFSAAATALSVLSGRGAALPSAAGHIVPAMITCVLGPTGLGRKSTPADDATQIIIAPFVPAPAKGEPPSLTIVRGTGSGEGFAEALADVKWSPDGARRSDPPEVQTGRRVYYVIDELGGLLEKVARDQAGNMIEFLLALFDARESWGHRTRAMPLTMTGTFASMYAASTYEWLGQHLTEGHVRSGLTNRILWLAGEPKGLLHVRPPIAAGDVVEFQKRLRSVLAASRGEMRLMDEADALHRSCYAFERGRETDGLLREGTARNDALALRLAMLLAISDGTTAMTEDHVAAAWAVVDYSRGVVAALLQRIEAHNRQEFEDRVRRAISHEISEGVFRKGRVYRRLKGARGMSAEDFGRTWQALERAGEIRHARANDQEVFAFAFADA